MTTDKHHQIHHDLAWLVGDADAFRTQIWSRRPMRRTVADGFVDLLTIDMIEAWLAKGARRPNFRMVKVGATIDVRDYTRTRRMGGTDVAGVADIDAITRLVAGGATLVMQNLEFEFESMRGLVDALAREVSHPIQANAYLTPPNAAGLGRHADTHDVLIVQLDGCKTWEVDGLGTFTVQPGDVVYIPRGTPHVARTSDQTSLHLTLGLLRVTARSMLRRVLDKLDPDLDEALPLDYAIMSVDQLTDAIRPLFEQAMLSLASTDLSAVAQSERDRASTQPSAQRQSLRSVLTPPQLDQDSRLRRVRDGRVQLNADRAEVHLADRVVSFPAAAEPALRVACGMDEMSVNELDGIDESSRVVVARRLIREGLLQLIAVDIDVDANAEADNRVPAQGDAGTA